MLNLINRLINIKYLISNEEVYYASGEPNITGVIKAKRLSWLNHILRSNMIAKEGLSNSGLIKSQRI